jgi:hypothetical protein
MQCVESSSSSGIKTVVAVVRCYRSQSQRCHVLVLTVVDTLLCTQTQGAINVLSNMPPPRTLRFARGLVCSPLELSLAAEAPLSATFDVQVLTTTAIGPINTVTA